LHHVVLERWSRGSSVLHRRDPRAKMAAALVVLVAVATADRGLPETAAALLLLLAGALAMARVPLAGAFARAALVLPFTAVFAAICWLAGDPARGLAIALKSYLSALAVLVLVSTTPLPALLRGLESAGVPVFLVMVVQFLYRYLFVVSEEAQHMVKAAASRGGGFRFRAAAGALAVLFARSYGRAEDIQRAMLARGFEGRFRGVVPLRFGAADAAFVVAASVATVLVRVAAGRLG
jgi:cobalt/nickel transport system permease protein